jgi:hypothetical protein
VDALGDLSVIWTVWVLFDPYVLVIVERTVFMHREEMACCGRKQAMEARELDLIACMVDDR